jgi:hypothetical protein
MSPGNTKIGLRTNVPFIDIHLIVSIAIGGAIAIIVGRVISTMVERRLLVRRKKRDADRAGARLAYHHAASSS